MDDVRAFFVPGYSLSLLIRTIGRVHYLGPINRPMIMKGRFTLLLSLAAFGAHAQRQLPQHVEHRDGYRAPAVLMPVGGERGNAFYLETFDTSLNGWTVETTVGAVDWKWTDVGPGPTASTYPVPVLNTSTPSGWAIVDDDFDGVSGASTNTSLISPVIDLGSAPPNLKVEFDQYFQEFQADFTYVGVSTDGGTTWDEVEINSEVGRDGRPNPELVDVNISAWVAANPSNVQLRFRYESTWDYGWQLDNIAIRELPANDMALVRVSNTAFDFATTEFEFMDYSIYPVDQVVGLSPIATVRNKGFDTQTGVTLELSVEGPAGSEGSDATTPTTYTPELENVITLDPFTPSGAIGEYTLTYSVTQDQTDEVPENNSIIERISVSDNIFAHDNGTVDNFQIQSPDNLTEGFEVGSYFILEQATFLTAIEVAIHEDTPVGGSVYGAIYFPSPDNTTHPDLLELTNNFTVTAADLNPIGGNTFMTLTFDQPVALDPGQPYFVVAGTFDGSDNIHFATSGISAAQVSNIHYPALSTDFQFFITRTPMVRMVLSNDVSVGELAGGDLDLGPNQPNPFSDHTLIPFNLQVPASVSLLVTDVTGKVVLQRDLGTRAAGLQQVRLEGDQLAAGVYTYTITAGDLRMSRRMVVAR